MTDLPSLEHHGRIDRVRAALAEVSDVTALLVSDLTDIRWCTGFTGSAGWLAVLSDRAVLGTDHRYRERAEAELGSAGLEGAVDLVAQRARTDQHAALVSAFSGEPAVGASAEQISHARWTELATELPLQVVNGAVSTQRRAKDSAEVARIAEACRIADAALASVAPRLVEHLTEVDVRDELEYLMRRLGADGPSYDTIVASGPANAARPHHGAERRTIREGDLVVIDVGALVDGYHSDMTRTFVIGDPSAEQLEWYDLVLAAQEAGLSAVIAGRPSREVDRASRSVFENAGRGDDYLHATGHGVGLAIHEDPFHHPDSTHDLVVGDVVTVEPGLYRAGVGGIRIEDLVVVTDAGCTILTHTPKDTPCLPSPPTI